MGRGVDQVVSVFAVYSNDPSLNPADISNFSENLSLERTKINKNRPELAHLKIDTPWLWLSWQNGHFRRQR